MMQATMATSEAATFSPITNERRGAYRYPVTFDIHWCSLRWSDKDSSGKGRCVNMRSTGILFTTSTRLQIGFPLKLSIAWPVRLNGACSLKLIVRGRVIRSCETSAALHIDYHEFRTRGVATG